MSNEVDSGGEESPGVLSDDHDHPPDSPDSNSTDPPDTNKGFPWLKVSLRFRNATIHLSLYGGPKSRVKCNG